LKRLWSLKSFGIRCIRSFKVLETQIIADWKLSSWPLKCWKF